MYGYFMNMVNYSVRTAVNAAASLFYRVTEDSINRITEDNEQRKTED
jgi:hypothetical protein